MKNRTKKILAAIVAGTMTMALLSGCGNSGSKSSGSGSSESSEKATKVVIGTQEMPNDEGIAKAMDSFSKEMGVEVEIKQFDSGKDVNTALASGSIDFGLLGSCPATLAIAQDLGVECIWIHEVLGATESFVARNESGAKTVADLKGKTIATPFASTAHFSALHALEEAGLSESDVTLLDMQPSEIYAAWQNGQIDATYVWEPTLTELGDGTVLLTSADMADAGYMTSNVELVRTEFAEANPELVTAYIKAVSGAVDLYKNTEDEAVSTIAKAMELSTDAAASQMSGSIWLTAEEQLGADYFGTSDAKGALVQNLYDTAAFLKDQGSIAEVPDKSVFEKAVNGSYIEEAVKAAK
ncbi:MAG: MetQ/NlpA family ABC transporter substrate-binding protein [Hespellia sp.]|nr:MetQ/NlpA family ABC transporter substrate-binding protein [Hespellia sp.]